LRCKRGGSIPFQSAIKERIAARGKESASLINYKKVVIQNEELKIFHPLIIILVTVFSTGRVALPLTLTPLTRLPAAKGSLSLYLLT
jgi:hypothetical protein